MLRTVRFDPFPVKTNYITVRLWSRVRPADSKVKSRRICNACDQERSWHQSSFADSDGFMLIHVTGGDVTAALPFVLLIIVEEGLITHPSSSFFPYTTMHGSTSRITIQGHAEKRSFEAHNYKISRGSMPPGPPIKFLNTDWCLHKDIWNWNGQHFDRYDPPSVQTAGYGPAMHVFPYYCALRSNFMGC